MSLVFYCHSFTSKILPSHINSGVGKQINTGNLAYNLQFSILQYIASTQVVKLWYVKLYDDKHSHTHTHIYDVYIKSTPLLFTQEFRAEVAARLLLVKCTWLTDHQ